MYATKPDMITRFGVDALVQLTDLSTPQRGEIVDTTLNAALVDASAEIDSYLAGRTPVPFEAPAHLRLYCCRLAFGLLLGDKATDAQRDEIKAVRDWLRAVARGDIPLGVVQPTAAADDTVMFNAGAKDWARDAA